MTFWVKQTTQWENKRNHSYHTCKFDIDFWRRRQRLEAVVKLSKFSSAVNRAATYMNLMLFIKAILGAIYM